MCCLGFRERQVCFLPCLFQTMKTLRNHFDINNAGENTHLNRIMRTPAYLHLRYQRHMPVSAFGPFIM